MGKFKELLIDREFNYTVGNRVSAFAHQQCARCSTWFRFSYDKAISEINEAGYFKIVCPECDSEYLYERAQHVPKEYLVFKEVD